MAKTKIKTEAGGKKVDLHEAGLETFEAVKVHRRELKSAPYNPRVLGDAEKRKLKKGIERHGMVAPVTWNVRTGNIVGGHQRISQLDALAGTDDYELTVAKIDVDEAREKEINILLNNPNAQGDWDLEQLSAILKDQSVNLEGAGFDHADLFRLLGDSPIIERNEKLDELAQKVREARDRYNEIEAKNATKNTVDFYFLAIFRTTEQRDAFLAKAGLPENRFQSGEELCRLCGISVESLGETAG